MEDIKALLEKYWQAETSLEEEQRLRAYFRGSSVDPSLREYRAVFGYFGEPVAVTLPPDFDERMMARLQAPVRRLYHRGWMYAAAAVVGVCLVMQLTRPAAPPVTDTYQDPAQAFAAVQQALRVVSNRMNKGKEMTRAGMTRLSNNYHLAFTN
ncbi:MAG TPA: hypothetical protein VL547_06445 [Dinghuibacter sp.]|jgi:hypothetical protein|uniref:hypothetical protein n=1 Tax=Dinghuibacter sp. TaxID=2024697 RepID=UPI002BE1C8B5|nr:hypothetical protein [Dinghuibacter sp.]HTJ11642.1 hypothetical protein [Dinghuibacter sp.]